MKSPPPASNIGNIIELIYVLPQSSSITILTVRNCFVTFSR